MDISQRLNGKLYRLFVALLLVYIALTGFGPMMNQVDLGWQVAQGRWIVEHAASYRHDAFNYPNLGQPVINEYPLFEVVLFFAWSVGWWGPCLLAAAGYLALVIVVFRGASLLKLNESVLVALSVGLMLLFFQVAFPLRPHLVTYVCVMALGVFLLNHREPRGWTQFWPMALMQIAWTNCHSGFVIGVAMVGLFGAEATIRRGLSDRTIPWATARTWLFAFLFILAACLINPHGWTRFYPPFFQDRLESIRAYVGEMEPLTGGLATIYNDLTLLTLVIVVLAAIRHRGAISFSFLLLSALFYLQAQEINKAWPVFGLFVPLLVMSSAAFDSAPRKSASWAGTVSFFIATTLAALAVIGRLNPAWDSSIAHQWREYNNGRCEMATEAVAWMKTHNIKGRLFHRCEDGGLLQQEGFTDGQTFADTGFGKYSEAFIHEVGLVNERPALVPHFLEKYHPDFVVCGNFCYQWPYYLRTNGWRIIFYSPNSSVWTRSKIRPDLPTVTDAEIEDAFNHDLASNSLPNRSLLGRNLIALNSLGLEDFAFATLTGLQEEDHRKPWFWEAARIMCTLEPRLSDHHQQSLRSQASQLDDFSLTVEFEACTAPLSMASTVATLKAIPDNSLSNATAERSFEFKYFMTGNPEALALARRTDCWDLRNGHHWQYLAVAEERWGSLDAARVAWKKAVFYYPDDAALMKAAAEFAEKHNDEELKKAIAETP